MIGVKSCFKLGCEAIKNPGKYNAVLGVSVGSRGFSKNDIKDYLEFCLEKFGMTMVLIVDSIKKYNFMALFKITEKEAYDKAIQEGNEFEVAVKRIIKTLKFQGKKTENLRVARWEKTVNSIPNYEKALSILKDAYKNNPQFHNDCLDMTKKYIQSRRAVNLFKKNKEIAINFLLEELSLFLTISNFNKEKYCIDVYPGKFPVIESILSNKYHQILEKLPKPIFYGHIELSK